MKDQKSQQGSEGAHRKQEKGGGLEFMGLRLEMKFKRRELRNAKAITPSEYFCLDEIEIGTIGAQNGKSTICSKAEFFLEDLSKNLGYKEVDKLWKILKSLQTKNLITREPTRSKGREIIGLNFESFGQILINSQHALEQKRWLRLVDKPKNDGDNFCEEPTNRQRLTDESSVTNIRTVASLPTNRPEVELEKPALDSLRVNLDGLRGDGKNQSFTLPFGSGTKKKPVQCSDPHQELQRQLADLRASGLG